MNDLQMARDFRASADYLRAHGWQQGAFGKPEGPRCMAGSILSVTGKSCVALDRIYVATLGFNVDGWEGPGQMGTWNDEPERTLEEVLDRLESTALALEVRALAAERLQEISGNRAVTELVGV